MRSVTLATIPLVFALGTTYSYAQPDKKDTPTKVDVKTVAAKKIVLKKDEKVVLKKIEPKPEVKVVGKAAVVADPKLTPPPPSQESKPAASPASQPVAPTSQPASVSEAVEQAKTGIAFIKAKNWFGASACAIFIIMFILGNVVKLWEKIGKRWSWILVSGLSLAGMLLARFAGGVSWDAAWLVLTSGPAAAVLNDLWKRGILGQEPSTPVRK